MDTNVSTIASDEEVAVQLDGSLSPHPGKLENSDIALFKQQLSESNTLFHTNIQTSELNVPCEPAEDLIDLSQELEKFLKKGTQTVATPKQNTHTLDQSIQKSSSPQQHTDKPNLQTTSKPKQDKLENSVEHKDAPKTLFNEKPSVLKASPQQHTDKPNLQTTSKPKQDKLENTIEHKNSPEPLLNEKPSVLKSSPQQHTDKPNLQTTSKPKQDKLENTIEHKNSPEPLLNEKPSVLKSSPQQHTDKTNLQTTSKPKQDKLENSVEHKDAPKTLFNEKPSVLKSSNQDRIPSLHPEDPNVIPLDTIPFQNINEIPMPVENVRPNAAILVQQIKDQVIDRILVSTNDIATDKTVKVIISPNVLEATEVNFQKMGDVLSIQFVSRSEGSLQFLQSNQTNLQGYLQTELKQFKDISVSVRSNGDMTEHPGDGRSRNRYEYQAVDEDEQ